MTLKQKKPVLIIIISLVFALVVGGLFAMLSQNNSKNAKASETITTNYYGLGKNYSNTPSYLPITVLENTTSFATDGEANYALKADGTLWSWGDNTFGQLGFADFEVKATPTKIDISGKIEKVIAKNGTVSTLDDSTTGNLKIWGNNDFGKLGNGKRNLFHEEDPDWNSQTPSPKPSTIEDLDLDQTNNNSAVPTTVLPGIKIASVAMGNNHVLALTSDGKVYSWGSNIDGQLGLGNKTQLVNNQLDNNEKYSPTLVPNLTDVKEVYAGYNSSYVVKNDGTVWSWGGNEFGKLGLGDETGVVFKINGDPLLVDPTEEFTDTNRLNPTLIPNLSNIKKLSVGKDFVIALNNDGKLYSWGNNTNGQLGINSITKSPEPQPVILKVGFYTYTPTDIISGDNFTLALVGARYFSWGANIDGQLGLGDNNDRLLPTRNETFNNIKSMYAGGSSVLMIQQTITYYASSSSEPCVEVNSSSSQDSSDSDTSSSESDSSSSDSETSSSDDSSDSSEIQEDSSSSEQETIPCVISSESSQEESSEDSSSSDTSDSSSLDSSNSSESVSSSISSVESSSSSSVSSSVDTSSSSSVISTSSESSSSVSTSSSISSSVDSSTSSSVSSTSSNPLAGKTILLDVNSVKFSPAKEASSRFKDSDLKIGVENNSDLVEGAVCVFKGTEYKTSANQNPVTITVGTSTYSSGKAETTLTKEQQNTPKWEFDIRCSNPSGVGENSNLSFGNNPSYFFKYGAIATVEIKGFVL